LNDLVGRTSLALGTGGPGSASYRFVDRFYTLYPEWTAYTRSTLRDVMRLISRPAPGAAPGGAPEALVFMLRGPWQLHTLHHYLIACALRRLGYHVRLVVCSGSVERCGLARAGQRSFLPPFYCKACRAVTAELADQGFGVLNLNDFKAPEEDRTVAALAGLSAAELGAYQFDGVRVAEALRPFLLRFYQGDFRRIEADRGELLGHVRAGVRYLGRAGRLLDRVRPACVCLFNGLFFPEALLGPQAAARGARCLYTERGMRKNTVFLAADEPACHYRADRLWDEVKGGVTEAQLGAARAYLEARMAGPEDPAGNRRDVADADEGKYRDLARTPYVAFFAPVTHDTTSMGKSDPAGGIFGTLDRLCRLAAVERKRLVVRSHPDERDPANPSRYPVRQYLADRGLLGGDGVRCLDSAEKWDPYRLAGHADACVVYNGTLGMELPCLGHRVFNVARSCYAGKGFTEDVRTLDDLRRPFAARPERLADAERELALKYLYFHVFQANLPLDALLDEISPSFAVPAGGDRARQEEQLAAVEERVAFLLGGAGHAAAPRALAAVER
jgi:hypothetical protein